MNCCGIDSYQDWGEVKPPTGTTGITYGNLTVPTSCCAETRVEMMAELEVEECTKMYANGCMPRLFFLVYQSAGLLGAGALTIAFIQVCPLSCIIRISNLGSLALIDDKITY